MYIPLKSSYFFTTKLFNMRVLLRLLICIYWVVVSVLSIPVLLYSMFYYVFTGKDFTGVYFGKVDSVTEYLTTRYLL